MEVSINIKKALEQGLEMAEHGSERAGYRRGHGIIDHTSVVVEKCVDFASRIALTDNEIFALGLAGLGHDIIQPAQIPVDSDLASLMTQRWGYNSGVGQDSMGDDLREEIESSRFMSWYLNRGDIQEEIKDFGLELSADLVRRISEAIYNTAGKANLETGMFVKPDRTEVEFGNLDVFDQVLYLSDKITGAEPSNIFAGIALFASLYQDRYDNLIQYVKEGFKRHVQKREVFFGMLIDAYDNEPAKIGIVSRLTPEEIERIGQNVRLQEKMLDELDKNRQSLTNIKTLAYELTTIQDDKRVINWYTLFDKWYEKGYHNHPDQFTQELAAALKHEQNSKGDFQ